jgi:hypothetical protein
MVEDNGSYRAIEALEIWCPGFHKLMLFSSKPCTIIVYLGSSLSIASRMNTHFEGARAVERLAEE